MTVKESLEKLLEGLPDERLRQIVDFVEFLQWREERHEWQQIGKAQLAGAYGANEPEYTIADLKPRGKP